MHVSTNELRMPVAEIAGSSFLWGATSGDSAGATLGETLRTSTARVTCVDLRGVRAFDPLFADRALLMVMRIARGQQRALYFETEDERVYESLERFLRLHSVFAPVRYSGSLQLAGTVAFAHRVIFDRLLTASPIPEMLAREELGEDAQMCHLHFRQLVDAGLASLVRPNIYATVIPPRGRWARSRALLKNLKLMVFIRPVQQAKLLNPFRR